MPINIANAVLKRTLKSAAIKEPVQAPVPGRGSLQKHKSPKSIFLNLVFLLIAFILQPQSNWPEHLHQLHPVQYLSDKEQNKPGLAEYFR